MISDPVAVMAALVGVAAFFFWLEKVSGWRVFNYLVPLIWIYAVPVLLRNFGVLPAESAAYDLLGRVGLPFVIVLLLLKVDVGAAVRIMGKGVVVMLLGTAGVVVGAAVGYGAVKQWLAPDAWKGFAALSGSWIGGTGNLAAVAAGVEAPPEQFGLAVIADTAMYIWWLPLLLASKALAPRFNRWARVSEERVARMDEAAAAAHVEEERPAMRHFLYLALIGLAGTWAAYEIAAFLPVSDVFSTSTWVVLLVTVFGIALSFTGAKRLPASHDVAMAVLYVFVARMGATASLEGLAQAPAFLLGAAIWITIHGLFCLAGAWLLKVDVHSAAIASAANIGGAASAPVVAAHHRESLVPVSILMALIGYALGNPVGLLVVAPLLSWVAGL
ncbi:MAG TPA: DUF819 family protein [Thermoanaerobaculia bacterium]|nr:DUF819 family protein [Thermoanaerobaculia bacterium]